MRLMISAEFLLGDGCFSLRISGHAGHSSDGSDIVCAAVSGIFYALLGYAANECERLHIKNISSGIADIEVSADGEEAMKLAYIGFLQIAASYPGTVSVKESVWGFKVNSPLCACR